MIYLDLLYFHLLLRKQHVKCGPPADRLDCSTSTKMASHPCGGTIANTVRVFTARVRPVRDILPRPSTHVINAQLYDAVMVALSQKLGRKCTSMNVFLFLINSDPGIVPD